MKKTYEAWAEIKDGTWSNITFASTEIIQDFFSKGLIKADAQCMYRVEADTREEAMAVHYVKMGWSPYRPGKPEPCPNSCGAIYYPEGSGECPNCGKIG